MKSNLDFVDQLVKAVPELEDALKEHVKDHDEVLPHVFMGDVTRFAVAKALHAFDDGVLNRLLNELEKGLASKQSVIVNLIGVSFIENLLVEEVAMSRLIPLMGPELRSHVGRRV